MLIAKRFLLILIILLSFQPFVVSEEEGWFISGGRSPDTENIKTKDGFGAQLWLTNDEKFFDSWNKPETPRLTILKSTKRNEPVFVIILFINPGVNEKGKTDVTFDVSVKKPDGSIYADFKDLEVWQEKPALAKNQIQLAAKHIGIGIENEDPLGKYTIEVLVKDNIKKVELPLYHELIAKE